MNILKIFFSFLVLIIISLVLAGWIFFGPAGSSTKSEVLVVPQDKDDFDVVSSLSEQNLIKNKQAFKFLLNFFSNEKIINPGGYRLSQKMNAWEVLTKISGKQDLFWVTISSCFRKEQTGEKLAEALGWSNDRLNQWNTLYIKSNSEYFEGIYYPDTYLLPWDESPAQIAQRFINHFNEKFAPLADRFRDKNIKWTTGFKIASLIARESAGTQDAKLISGIIWNRLDKEMPLQIDATMQYTLGKNTNGSWWGNINLDEKQSDSPYNSYLYKGLPPTPICSPDIDFIEAAVDPEETDCLFYLHDSNRQIHCAKTYKEHLANIKEYLSN